MTDFISEHKNGLIGTIIVHGLVLIFLLLMGFFTPLPIPGEQGILVNFGDQEQGFGTEEPAPANPQEVAQPEVKEEEEEIPPPPATPATTPVKAKEQVLTQNIEKTAAIESAAEAEARKKQEEADRLRKIEQERQLEEQRERERLAEIARKKKEAEEKKAAEINSRVANAFNSSGAGTTDSQSSSQGVTFPAGNQGSGTGAADTDNYGAGGSGGGTSGNGPSFSLAGRDALSLPKPAYPGNEQGVIVVAVTVDKYGKVTNAEPGVQGTNTYNPDLMKAAREAALKARFNADPKAAAFQKGTITYRFVLD
ncbi:MAG: TonB family protein [Mangrovibacterium sp.]